MLPSKPSSLLAEWQHEVASVVWQQFKPNGATTQDVFVGARYQQDNLAQAYVRQEIAAVARHQLLGERELQRPNRPTRNADASPIER
jgi:hypothetical protein